MKRVEMRCSIPYRSQGTLSVLLGKCLQVALDVGYIQHPERIFIRSSFVQNAISSGFRQISWVRLAVTVFAMIAVICVSSTERLLMTFPISTLLPSNFHIDLIVNALTSNTVASALPILSILPFSGSYVDDIKSKFARFFCIRSSYNTYAYSHIFVCMLSGGLVIVVGVLIEWGISALVLLPMEKVAEAPSESTVFLLKTCVLLFLNGGLWAVLGMTMSTIMESKYIAYASPFIVYYLLVILYERYFPNAWLLYPKNWLDSEVWPYGIGSAALFLPELTFLCGLVFYIRAKRRLEQL